MADENKTRDLIRLIYECSVDAPQWPRFLAAFGAALKAPSSGLLVQDYRNRHGNLAAGNGIDPYWGKRYDEYYSGVNVLLQRARPVMKSGHILASEELIGDAALTKSEIHNDFLRPQNHFYTLAGVLSQEDAVYSMIMMVRSRRVGPAQEHERALMRELMPHLQTALRLHHHIAGLDTRLGWASAALDHMTQAIIVTTSTGRILHMNRRAEALLKLNDALSVATDGLRAGSSGQTARLREFIARTASTVTGRGRHPGGVMQLQRTGLLPLRLQIMPLASPSSSSMDRRPAVAIFIDEPTRLVELDPTTLCAMLDLSPMEARLTAALVGGKTIQQFAKEAGVSLNTSRTLLYRAFAKTGVSRQAELVRLALTCVGGLIAMDDPRDS